VNLIYLKVGKGKDKTDGRIIISSGNSVARISFSQNARPLKEIHYTTSPGKLCTLHRDLVLIKRKQLTHIIKKYSPKPYILNDSTCSFL